MILNNDFYQHNRKDPKKEFYSILILKGLIVSGLRIAIGGDDYLGEVCVTPIRRNGTIIEHQSVQVKVNTGGNASASLL